MVDHFVMVVIGCDFGIFVRGDDLNSFYSAILCARYELHKSFVGKMRIS